MRTFKNLLWALLPLFCLSLAVSCTENQTTDETPNNGGTNGPSVVKDTVIKMKKDLLIGKKNRLTALVFLKIFPFI